MSDLSEKVRAALYAKMNVVSVVGTGLATAIYYGKAPESAAYPFIEFQRVPGIVDYAFRDTRIGERDRWFIRCFADEDSSTSKAPAKLNEDILQACATAIGNSLSLSGATAYRVTRIADIPEVIETVNDRQVTMNGFQLEIYTG